MAVIENPLKSLASMFAHMLHSPDYRTPLVDEADGSRWRVTERVQGPSGSATSLQVRAADGRDLGTTFVTDATANQAAWTSRLRFIPGRRRRSH